MRRACYIPRTLRHIKATLVCASLAAFIAAGLFELGAFRALDAALASFLDYPEPGTARASQYLLILTFALGIAWTTVDIGRNLLKAVIAVVALAETFAAAWALNLRDVFFSPFASIAAIVLSFTCAFFYGQTSAGRRKRTLHQFLGDRVSARTFTALLDSDIPLIFEGEQRTATVVICELFNHDELADSLNVQDHVAMTNAFLRNSADVLVEHGGYLDECDGESLRVVFGAPLPDSRHAIHACEAALELIQRLDALNRECHAKFGKHFDYRVGINSGEMIMAAYGSRRVGSLSVAGESVNFARRLCAANTIYGTHILVGAGAFVLAEEGIEVRPMEFIQRDTESPEREEVYELLARHGTLSAPERERRDLFWKGIVYFREQRWDDALTVFRQAAQLCGADAPCEFYIHRIEQVRAGRPAPGFNNPKL